MARRAGCSVQQVRNLERDEVLPSTTRTPAGYRTYTEIHALAAVAYTALAAGVGPIEAKTVMRTAHRSSIADLLSLLDAAHARLSTERRDIVLAREAVAAISSEPIDDPRTADAMTISELAGALGVRTSTLRHWDSEGLLNPARSPTGRARTYTQSTYETRRSSTSSASPGTASQRSENSCLRCGRRNDETTSPPPSTRETRASRSVPVPCSTPPHRSRPWSAPLNHLGAALLE